MNGHHLLNIPQDKGGAFSGMFKRSIKHVSIQNLTGFDANLRLQICHINIGIPSQIICFSGRTVPE